MNIGILIFLLAEELDFVGPWEMFAIWKKVAKGPETCLFVAESTEPVTCAKGMSINPHVSFHSCPKLDYLLVPGGQGTRNEVNNSALIGFVSEQAKDCKAVLSVCTGAFILHSADLLSGKRATTHWASLKRLRALGDVDVLEERFVHDGSIWSSAGVSAGIDMALEFIASVAGQEAAGMVQLASEYYPVTTIYGSGQTHAQAPGYAKGG